ncbi:hypothetical protein V6N13_035761 [Hibiscus sabdariffa]
MLTLATGYFEELFRSSSPSDAFPILSKVQPRVTVAMNDSLLSPFSADEFNPSRGLRQGDPLSPYLFLICAEGLSVLLNDANRERTVCAGTIGRERLEVGHLLFADDSILFGDASIMGATNMRDVLHSYGNIYGQRVNFDKSLIFFSSNVEQYTRGQIGSLLGVRVSTDPEKYMGLPIMVGRKKREAFSYYLDRFNKKTNNWGARWLSMGEALFDEEQVAIICAIPLSKSGICDEIIWRLDGSGHYSVKSGYRLLRGDLPAAANVSVHAYSSLVTRFFNEMWSVNLPAKVKINMWRIANSFVPNFATL